MGSQSSVLEEDRRTIVCIGVTGSGKSTLGNVILGKQHFQECAGFSSGTTAVEHADSIMSGLPIRVIDTVGFMSTEEKEAGSAEIADIASFGVDAFLLVMKFGRFTEESERHFRMFHELMGDKILKHSILVFTHVQNRKLQEHLDSAEIPPALTDIIGKVGGVVGVESKDYRRHAEGDVLKEVRRVVESNDGKRFSNNALRAAEARREGLQDRINGIHSAGKRAALTRMRLRMNNGVQTYNEVLAAIEEAEVAQTQKKFAAFADKPPTNTTATCCAR